MTLPYALKYEDAAFGSGYIASIDSISISPNIDIAHMQEEKFVLLKLVSNLEILLFISGQLEAVISDSGNCKIVRLIAKELTSKNPSNTEEVIALIERYLEFSKIKRSVNGGVQVPGYGTIFVFIVEKRNGKFAHHQIGFKSNEDFSTEVTTKADQDGIVKTYADPNLGLFPDFITLHQFINSGFDCKRLNAIPVQNREILMKIRKEVQLNSRTGNRESAILENRNTQELFAELGELSHHLGSRPFSARPIHYFDITSEGINRVLVPNFP